MSWRGIFEFLHKHRVLVQVAFVALVVGVYGVQRTQFRPFLDFENWVMDKRQEARAARPAPKDLVIIGVDESAFALGPTQPGDLPELAYLKPDWPWNRKLWGLLTERFLDAGARVVAFDFLFRDPTPEDAEVGEIFDKYASRVVITSRYSIKEEAMATEHPLDEPSDDLIPLNGPEIVGLANEELDLDNVERSITHGFNQMLLQRPSLADDPKNAGKLQPDVFSFSWLVASKALGHAPARDPAQSMLINYYGPLKTINTLQLEDVLENWNTFYHHGEYFKDKVVFFGPLSEVRFKDDHATPFGALPGVEIQATVFANLVTGEWLRSVPGWVGPALAVLFGLASLLICLRVQAVLAKVGLLLGLGVGFVVVTQWLFVEDLLVVPVVGAALGVVVCGGFGTIYDFVLEQYERRRMLGTFESMVSPGVARMVLAERGDFAKRLGGQRKELVVLFSDIRSFTAWSEKVGPEALVAQLNEYFLEMVGVIQQEGGTVQKYIGDALMAAWGDVREEAPAECAENAVRAALRMKGELVKLNAGWVGKPGREQLSFGIGINFGEGVVGQIGHPRRQEFTVMGDTVNLAARFESATKQYHQAILVGEAIYQLTKGKFVYRMADKMQVKGKSFGVPVYVPIGARVPGPLPPGQAEYEAAIEKYYARDFTEAEKLFRAAGEKIGDDDFLCENFADRAAYYATEPPPEHWDGTWVLKEK
jgi:adenylate cyclase